MAGVFADPNRTYYGGSADALAQQRADALAQMQGAQQLGNNALGGGLNNPYGGVLGAGQYLAQQGRAQLDRANAAGPMSLRVDNGAASAAGAAVSAFDPTRVATAASQMAADQGARAAMSVARSGPNAALAMRQALQMQGAQSLQAQQQAGVLGAQMAGMRAQLAVQNLGAQTQATSAYNAAALQQQAQDRQFALAQTQGGAALTQQEAARAQQLAQFREGLYSGRDQNVNAQQLSADQLYQQMQMQAAQQKQAMLGTAISAAGGVLGMAGGMV